MAISFNTGATASVNTAASVNITIPAGVLTNDVMIMSLEVFTETSTAPTISFSGAGGTWTLVSVSTGVNPEVPASGGIWAYGYAYFRVVTAGDPGATLTVTESGSAAATTWFGVAIASYTGANTAAPVDVAGGASNAAAGQTVTLPTKTTGVANDWAIFLGSGGPGTSSNWTGPVGSTQRQAVVSSAGVGAAINDSNASVGAAGTSIGGGTFTGTGGSGNQWLSGFTIGLAPATGAAGPRGAPPAAPDDKPQLKKILLLLG